VTAKASSSQKLKTLDRVISRAGFGSRSDARKWIADGRVAVNGKTVRNAEQWIDIARDRVMLDGKRLRELERIYILLYKPRGYITSYKDPQNRPTVYDLIRDISEWVAPVGRLDQDTSGLLILTNDNDLADYLTDPEHQVTKTYLVKTSTKLDEAALERLRGGVDLDDGPTRPAKVKLLRESASASFLEISITEGRNRQVRRMIEAVGSRVRKLVRTAIGPIEIGGLEIGKWRELSPAEIKSLRRRGTRIT
jgi:23S rRNA pseudouridine2605 synthase